MLTDYSLAVTVYGSGRFSHGSSGVEFTGPQHNSRACYKFSFTLSESMP